MLSDNQKFWLIYQLLYLNAEAAHHFFDPTFILSANVMEEMSILQLTSRRNSLLDSLELGSLERMK